MRHIARAASVSKSWLPGHEPAGRPRRRAGPDVCGRPAQRGAQEPGHKGAEHTYLNLGIVTAVRVCSALRRRSSKGNRGKGELAGDGVVVVGPNCPAEAAASGKSDLYCKINRG